MPVITFGAIDIGSYDVTLEIFEISKKNGLHCIDKVRHRIELGRDSYSKGIIGPAMVDELCDVLNDFRRILKEYRVDAYSAIATSAIREAENDLFIIGKIKHATGIDVTIMSNSELRFLSYKAVASIKDRFEDMIRHGTAMIDLSGGSTQISVFDHSELISTQNLHMGSLRLRERLQEASARTSNYDALVEQLIHYNVNSFRKMYLGDRKIENVILSGDFITEMIFKDAKHKDRGARILSREDFDKWFRKIDRKSIQDLAMENDIPVEFASLLLPSAIVFHKIIEVMDPKTIWIPGTHLSRGLAYEYAERNNILKVRHNFDNDIFSSSKNLARRYDVNEAHARNMDMTALAIFDAIRPLTGFGDRERLMLRVAVMLYDVGKYISYTRIGESSYNIIMTNEIIGLSHAEREVIALSARYMKDDFPQYEDIVENSSLNTSRYLHVAAFVAIMRLANALDQSHLQKVKEIEAELKTKKLVLKLSIDQDYSLELGLIRGELDFFNEVFGIRPQIKTRRIV